MGIDAVLKVLSIHASIAARKPLTNLSERADVKLGLTEEDQMGFLHFFECAMTILRFENYVNLISKSFMMCSTALQTFLISFHS